MEPVHLVEGHHVDVFLQEIDLEEMQAAVQVHAPVGETGGVLDVHRRKDPVHAADAAVGQAFGGKQLQKRLQGVEGAGAVGTLDEDPAAFHPQEVSFRGIAVGLHEIDTAALREFFREAELFPGHGPETFGEESSRTREFLGTVHPDGRVGRNPERALQHLEMGGQRDDLRRGRLLSLRGTGGQQQREQEDGVSSHGWNVLVTVFPSGRPARVKPRALITASLSTWNGTPS